MNPPWDAEILARVRHLHLRARVLTQAVLQGEHRSRLVGQAIEFADYQEYTPGMDLRRLDWRAWGRTDRLMVRRYETETELPTTLILDISADLATGAPPPPSGVLRAAGRWFRRRPQATQASLPDLEQSKAGRAIVLAATLLYWFHLHHEPVGLELVGGEGPDLRSLAPRSGRTQLQAIFLTLAAVRPAGRADLAEALVRVGARVRRRSAVLVLSDGMEEPERWLPALSALARQRTDVRFFHLYDRREWALELDRPAKLFSPEGGAEIALDPGAARVAIRQIAREYAEEVRAGVTRWGGVYVPTPTDGTLEDAVRRGLSGDPARPGFDPFEPGGAL